MPGEPPTTSTPPASYFEPVGDRDGTSARSAGSMRQARGEPASATRQADRQLDHLARVASARLDRSAERAAVEGERERGLDRRALDPPARAVHAARHVERDDGRGEVVDAG